MCQEFCSQWEYLGRYPRPPPPPDRYTPGRYTPPGSSACWEIRATSGRYVSYWNAFLFSIVPILVPVQVPFPCSVNEP